VAIVAEKQREETSVIAAVVDVLDAGQRVILDRVELAMIEAKAAVANTLASLALLLFGLGLLLVGWVGANVVGVLILARSWTNAQAVALAALVNLVAGGLALILAKRRVETIGDASRGQSAAVSDGGSNG